MATHTKLNIVGRETKGMTLIYDHEQDLREMTNLKDIKISGSYKILLRIKVNGHTSKKTFDFDRSRTLNKAIDIVNDQRLTLREQLRTTGTLREKSIDYVETKTVGSEWKRYITEKSIKLSEGTIIGYQGRYDTHFKHLASRDIYSITRDDIQKIITEQTQQGKKYHTVMQNIATFRAFLNHCKHKLDWDDLTLPTKVDNRRHYEHSIETTKKIVKAMREYQHPEIRAVFMFLLRGRRIGEVMSLKYEHINFENNTYKILAENSKSGRELTFDLDEELKQVVLERQAVNKLVKWRIFKITGHWVRKKFYQMLKDKGLPHMHLHDVRHMFASTAYQNGVPIADVSRALGHTNIQTAISRYVTSSKEQASNASNAFLDLTE